MIEQKLRDDMMMLKGKLDAICFPIVTNDNGYYDLVTAMCEQYDSILNRLFDGYERD